MINPDSFNPAEDRPPPDGLDRSIRQALRAIEPPPDLYGKILAAAAAEPSPAAADELVTKPSWWNAIAAAGARFFGTARGAFEDFRIEVATVRTPQLVAGRLKLDLRSGELSQLVDWLAQARSPRPEGSEFRPSGNFGPVGCKTFQWRGKRFSVICFYDQNKRGMHLFSISGTSLQRPPPGGAPQWCTLGGLPTASWSRGGTSFVLVAGTPGMNLGEYF
jgi:hypothetical protein